jgi:hypothetical protein
VFERRSLACAMIIHQLFTSFEQIIYLCIEALQMQLIYIV